MAGPDGHGAERTPAAESSHSATGSSATTGSGPGMAELRVRLSPNSKPADTATIVGRFPAERDEMMAYVARTAGNAYVQAVIAATQTRGQEQTLIASDPEVVRFADTEAGGASPPVTIRLSTTSAAPIEIESIEVFPSHADDGPPAAGEFVAWEPSARKLQADAPLSIDTQFHPARMGRLIAQLRIHGRSNGQAVRHQTRLVGRATQAKDANRDQRESSVALMSARAYASSRVAVPNATPKYTDMLAAVYAARQLSVTRNRADEIHARKLLMPVFERLGELRSAAVSKLRKFDAGYHAGLTSLSMSEAAIADWIQKISLGSSIEPSHLVSEFEIGGETIRFLTGEREDAKDLRGFDHASKLVGTAAAGVTLGLPLAASVGAMIATEAPLLSFAARGGLSRLLAWGAANPVLAVELTSAFIGVGVAINSWDELIQALQDPREAAFLLMQVAMELAHLHQARSSGIRAAAAPHVEPESIHTELHARTQKLRSQMGAIETSGTPETAAPTRRQEAVHEHEVVSQRISSRDPDEVIVDPASPHASTTKPVTTVQTIVFRQLVSDYASKQSTVQSFRANPVVGPQIARLSDDEVISIIGYTGSDYDSINTALRSKDPQQLARMEPYIQMLRNALSKLPDHGGAVHRGTTLTQAQIDLYVPGAVVEEAAFTSTSYDHSAKFSGNVSFEIRSQTGSRIDFLSRFPGEKEVLLSAGTRLQVVSKTYDVSSNKWHIVLEEIP